MKKDNFDEMLTKALREYIKDTENNADPVSKVNFSKRHEKNMEDIFTAIENGTLGNFEESEKELGNNMIEIKFKRSSLIKFAKIVAFILLGIVVSLSVAPRLTAWRSEDSEFYGENQEDYAWHLRNDTTEILESNVENSGEYLEIFGYLPEGFEVKNITSGMDRERIEIKNYDNMVISLRIIRNVNNAIDMKNNDGQIIYMNDMKIKYIKTKNQNIFLWNYNNNEYTLYSDIEFEVLYEILENIKFENF